MRISLLCFVTILKLSALTLTVGIAGPVAPVRATPSTGVLSASATTFDLTTFGAVGDGITDDGPALQSALDAIAEAGGGTLMVPAGRYAIITPVQKNFSGSGATLTILGVASSTSVDTKGNGQELTRGLDLTSEFVIKTGAGTTAITLMNLDSLLIAEMVFIGTPEALTDAQVTLGIYAVANATIRHSEFYGLSTLWEGGAIVHADNSRLIIERTVFLGCTGNSGVRNSVVLNTAWKAFSITESIFADYGQRPNYYGKLGLAAPFSWIMVGNAAAISNLSPRREATIRNVFLDEGGFFGISVIPDYYDPQSATSDLIYISDLRMNVSSLNAAGIYIHRAQRVLIDRAKFGLSLYADAAVSLVNVNEATLDQLECLAAANRIRANDGTGTLTVINSIYAHLDSLAQSTEVITTAEEDEDPVQYVREEYLDELGHEPDGAGHDYWSDNLLECNAEETCLEAKRQDLSNYLEAEPSPLFSVTGKILNEGGAGVAGVALTLNGSQAVGTQTDNAGNYRFEGLPTSGVYNLTPARVTRTFNPSTWTTTTPSGNRVANFTAILNNYSLSGRVLDSTGLNLSGATVTLSGSRAATATTDAGGNYSFTVPAEGNYTVSVAKVHYAFAPPSTSFSNLSGNQSANFSATLNMHTISGQLNGPNGNFLAGATVSLSGAQVATAVTTSSGTYAFNNLPAGHNYTVTPAKQHYSFAPQSRVLNDLGSNQAANFIGTLVNYSIAGRVSDGSGSGISGAIVTLSGTMAATTTTDAGGNYSFTVIAQGNYNVSAATLHYIFAPVSTSFRNLSGNQTANFTGTLHHAITGRVTDPQGEAFAGVTVSLSGSQSNSMLTGLEGRFSFTVPAGGTYTVTPTKTAYLFTPTNALFVDLDGPQEINFSSTLQKTLEFSAASYQIVEGETSLVVTLLRKGDASGPASATYSTSDDSGLSSCSTRDTDVASSSCDYITAIGNVHFAPGETSKTFSIPIIDDGYAEGNENFEVSLSNLSGVSMGSHATASVTIADNETVNGTNPIEGAGSFVRQHYIDFFNREPDAAGLAFWTNQITACGNDAGCVELKRVNVSAAFFLSTEFRETGYLVYRIHKAAYGNIAGTPVPVRFGDLLPDTRQIGQDVVVGEPGWAEVLESNTQAFMDDFVTRLPFTSAYPTTMTPIEFVNSLFTNAGVTPAEAERAAAISEFGTAETSADMVARGRALRRVAENQTFAQQEFNKAFVLMQYFGYLRRNPNDAPEHGLNFDGYNFWLGKLNQFNGNFIDAEMVKSFILAGEYKQRFGP